MIESKRMQGVQTPIIPTVAELIRAHPGTISLGQGVVHYPPPVEAMNRMQEAMTRPVRHLYGPVAGQPELVETIRRKLALENGIDVSDDQDIIVTAGGNMAFQNAILAIADPGDEIILQTPYYFNHDMAICIASCKPVFVPTDADYQLQVDRIEQAITPKTRAVVTVSPNNPTGAVYDEASLRAVNELCKAHDLFHISDEAYEYFTYDGVRHFSPGSITGSGAYTLSLYSLSKAYGFAGWRVGYMVIPRTLQAAIKKIQDTNLICPPMPSQYGALGALEVGVDYCMKHLGPLAEVRELVINALGTLGAGVTVPPAQGAFYCFVRVHTDRDAMALVRQLIESYKVAVIPGTTFGMHEGCYLRIAYGALQKETVAEAVGRLVRGLKELV